jgi:hypothetical protein
MKAIWRFDILFARKTVKDKVNEKCIQAEAQKRKL